MCRCIISHVMCMGSYAAVWWVQDTGSPQGTEPRGDGPSILGRGPPVSSRVLGVPGNSKKCALLVRVTVTLLPEHLQWPFMHRSADRTFWSPHYAPGPLHLQWFCLACSSTHILFGFVDSSPMSLSLQGLLDCSRPCQWVPLGPGFDPCSETSDSHLFSMMP